MHNIIAIDGPSASGKTSAARLLAARLGVPYVSSGLLYRAAAWLSLQQPSTPLEQLLAQPVRLLPTPEHNQVWVQEQDISDQLHTEAIDRAVSAVASQSFVRAWANARLREVPAPFVVDGRDMGAVFEHSSKFYLHASPEVRALRRAPERSAAYQQVLQELIARDYADAAQSQIHPKAVFIDTNALTLEGVVDALYQAITHS